MTWLTWRQLRGQALAVTLLVGAAVAVLVVTGRPMHDLVARGPSAFDLLTTADRALFYAGLAAVAVAPALLGVFWGAPLVAREIEAGTHRLVWNQGVTRGRWLVTKLAVTATSAAVGVGALCLAVDWWAGPIDGALSQTRGGLPGRLTPIGFAMRGVVPIAYAVFAVVLGVALGLVLRRTLPAMALTLALFIAIQVAVPIWVRPHLAPSVHATLAMTARPVDSLSLASDGQLSITLATGHRGDWVLTNRTVDAAGRPAALPAWFATCTSSGPSSSRSSGTSGTAGADRQEAGPVDPCLARLSEAGYRQELVYQPASHFWRLQLTESALFLAVSAALAGCCLLWLRRRDG